MRARILIPAAAPEILRPSGEIHAVRPVGIRGNGASLPPEPAIEAENAPVLGGPAPALRPGRLPTTN